MSVITKRGDEGQTDLMFGKKSAKTAPRLEAYGTVDELNSALGVARAAGLTDAATALIDAVQEKLVGLMGELATLEEDLPEYDKRGYARPTAADVAWIEQASHQLESEFDIRFKGWARPGKDTTIGAAHLDLARAICRRAERRLAGLREEGQLTNTSSYLFMNRMSDFLWLLARAEAAQHAVSEK